MNTSKKLLVFVAVLVAIGVILWSSDSIRGGSNTYEIQPRITLPEQKTDTTRIIDAYERLTDRFMDLNSENFKGVRSDVKGVDTKLDLLDLKLTQLSERIERIERILEPQLKQSDSVEGKPKDSAKEKAENKLAPPAAQ